MSMIVHVCSVGNCLDQVNCIVNDQVKVLGYEILEVFLSSIGVEQNSCDLDDSDDTV